MYDFLIIIVLYSLFVNLIIRQIIERVHRKFLRFAAFHLNINYAPHDYTPINQLLGLSCPLANR